MRFVHYVTYIILQHFTIRGNMRKSEFTILLLITVIIVTYPAFSIAQEDRVLEKIQKITPTSGMTPVTIKTIRHDVDTTTESQSVTKGVRRRYRYDLEQNPISLLANSAYEQWFLSVGLNDSDPNDERYGIWLSVNPDEIEDDFFSLHILSPQKQYLVLEEGTLWNISAPIDKVQELEREINTANFSWARPYYSVNFSVDSTGILVNEMKESGQRARIVSFTTTMDGDFSFTFESPKSKSFFTFVSDNKAAYASLENYNREHGTNLEAPLQGMMTWTLKESNITAEAMKASDSRLLNPPEKRRLPIISVEETQEKQPEEAIIESQGFSIAQPLQPEGENLAYPSTWSVSIGEVEKITNADGTVSYRTITTIDIPTRDIRVEYEDWHPLPKAPSNRWKVVVAINAIIIVIIAALWFFFRWRNAAV